MKINALGKAVYLLAGSGKCGKGASKFFGCPDLPDGFDWPADAEEYDLEFICQLNCAELHAFNPAFPEKGLLYFFGNIAGALGAEDAPLPVPGFQAPEDFRVYYSELPPELLLTGEIVDEEGQPTGFNELGITCTGNRDECEDALHQAGGEPPENSYPDDFGGDVLLFSLDSFSGEDFELTFPENGYMYFLIDRDDLARGDFGRVRAYLAV